MKNLERLLKEGTELLEQYGIMEARLDAWLLLEYVLGKNRAWFLAHRDETADEKTEETYVALIGKRAQHIPLQHLTGRAYFMGYEFYVNDQVLIPRQDTEILVEEASKILAGTPKPQILDMCTGSGCILESLLLMHPDASGIGVDLSEGALAVAVQNARDLGVSKRCIFVQSDLFRADIFQEKDGQAPSQYDILVSNPPYIRTAEIEELTEEVRLHDPFMALDGKEDGLFFYRNITAQAMRYIKPGGTLLFEIGYDQGEAVQALLKVAGFSEIRLMKDLSGLDRVVCAEKHGDDLLYRRI
jgi:release factor glutamine methyltransferase